MNNTASQELSPIQMKKRVMTYARSLGFERIGITTADPAPADGERLSQWLGNGYAGEMDYMLRQPERRSHPEHSLAGARSLLALAVNYFNPDSPASQEGKIARYAWGKDYHRVLGKRLDALVRYMESLTPHVRCKTFVDAGPLLERAFARRAGLGFIGKNTVMITRGLGSWVFLASVSTTLELPPDPPDTRSCGECRLCIDACPTQALTEPYQLDARRCISYLTIESKAPIPVALRREVGARILGCDICQDVCPHNTRIPTTPLAAFKAMESSAPTLQELLSLRDDESFQQRFSGTPFLRPGRAAMVRNACVAAAALKRSDLLEALEAVVLQETDPVAREHAAWAIGELKESR